MIKFSCSIGCFELTVSEECFVVVDCVDQLYLVLFNCLMFGLYMYSPSLVFVNLTCLSGR
jgi:hypothetical protein